MLRVEEDVLVIVDGRDFEGSEAWQHIKVGLLLVLVGNKLAVDIEIVPGLGHLVHVDRRIWNLCFDRCAHVIEELHVLAFVMARIPRVGLAVTANFNHECRKQVCVLILWLTHPNFYSKIKLDLKN